MEPRRNGRPSQVSPRQPSTGRPAPRRVKPIAPDASRLSRYRRIERRRGLPPLAQIVLAAGIVLLSAVVLVAGINKAGPLLSAAVKGIGGLASGIVVPKDSPTPLPSGAVSDAPTIDTSSSQYTNATSVDITVHVPGSVAGQIGFTCRLWVTLPNTPQVIAMELPIGATTQVKFAGIALVAGDNTFTATIVGPGGESSPSSPVTWTLDTTKPKVTIASPANGASITAASATLKGTTKPSSAIRVVNTTNGATATATADAKGAFTASIAVGAGPNSVTITATDLAGNVGTAALTLTHPTGQLRVSLTGTLYKLSSTKAQSVTFTATVTGPDGRRAAGASVVFTVTLGPLSPIVSGVFVTDATGTAAFTTTIPAGVPKGSSGIASVLVTLADGVTTGTARQALTVQ